MKKVFYAFLGLLFAVTSHAQISSNFTSVPSFTINQQIGQGTPELSFNSTTGVTHYFTHSNNGEFYLVNNQAGLNTLVLRNTNSSGYAAVVTDQADTDFPSTAQNPFGYYQHATFGYGQNLALNGRAGLGFIESARYDGTNNPLIWPLQFSIQQTGGAWAGSVYAFNAVVTSGTNTITINGGGNFTSVTTGMMLREQGDGGFFPPGTTVTGGGGTATLTLSKNALISNGYVPIFIGTTTYGQYNAVVFRDLTSIDWYPWSTGRTTINPYMRLDRQNGRVGIGAYANSINPSASLDVIGNAIFGTYNSGAERSLYASSAAINIASTSAEIIRAFYGGVNSVSVRQLTGPYRWEIQENNGSNIPFRIYFDGTNKIQAGTVQLSSTSGPTIASGTGAPSGSTYNGVTGATAGTPATMSVYYRTDGAAGSRVYYYVSGAWAATATP